MSPSQIVEQAKTKFAHVIEHLEEELKKEHVEIDP